MDRGPLAQKRSSMSFTSHWTVRSVSLVVALLLTAAVFAQTSTGQISGTVTDASGAMLPGVTVTARNQGTGLTRSNVTTSGGLYVVPLLPPGTYDVTAELEGFQPFQRRNVVVNVGGDVTVGVAMRVGLQEAI